MAEESVNGSGIYQIRNLVNGKRYIGSAKSVQQRWREHRSMLRCGKHHSRHLQASWNKHGQDNFCFEVLWLCPAESLIAEEQRHFDALKPEYNVAPKAGNTLGVRCSEDKKQKIRARAIGRKLPPRAEEYRKKVSERCKGRIPSPQHMEALQRGRSARIWTDEQRAKLSSSILAAYAEGRIARTKSEEHRHKVGKFWATLTDEQVREIRSLRAAGVTGRSLAAAYGSNPVTISLICSGKTYKWVAPVLEKQRNKRKFNDKQGLLPFGG